LFDRIERDGSRAVVRLKDGGVIRVPPGLEARLTEMESLLRYHHHLALIGPLGGAGGPVSEQPWNFSNERPIPVPPEGEAIIADPDSLRALLHRYHALAIYQESIPSSFDLARLFTGLHRTNGGLALFGVQPGGSLVGLPEEEIQRAQERLARLSAKLTETQVRIGRIELEGKVALFALFNPIAAHALPMESVTAATSKVEVA
jgi:hypothetical protein